MAAPSRGAFTAQLDQIVGDSIIPLDLSAGWAENGGGPATEFEVLRRPPGFDFDGIELSGTLGSLMDYFIAVRASNRDGVSDWVESHWTVGYTTSQPTPATFRKLFGLRWDAWPASPQLLKATPPDSGVVFIRTAQLQGTGTMQVNDIPNDGTASTYDAAFFRTQVLPTGDSSTYLRATAPGWEVIIDTAPVVWPLIP